MRAAIWSMDRSLLSSNWRARSTRCRVSHWPGVMPTPARNRRGKLRTLIPASRASCASESGPSRRCSVQARAAAVVLLAGSGTGRSMYWAWPPSRQGGTTQRRATWLATSLPWSRRTQVQA
jgi:hypothetical protein